MLNGFSSASDSGEFDQDRSKNQSSAEDASIFSATDSGGPPLVDGPQEDKPLTQHGESQKPLAQQSSYVFTSSFVSRDVGKGLLHRETSENKHEPCCVTGVTPDTVVRLLIAVAMNPGVAGTRLLAKTAGLEYRHSVRLANEAEDRGLLRIKRGHSHWDDEQTEPNRYALTQAGQALMPEPIGRAKEDRQYDLWDPMWQERHGYGLRGWLLALSVTQPMLIDRQHAAKVWGCTLDAAGKRLHRLAAKPNGGLVSAMNHGQYYLNPDCWAPSTVNEHRYDSLDAASKRFGERIDQIEQGLDAMRAFLLEEPDACG